MKKILLCVVAFMIMLCCLTSCRPKAHNFPACDNLEYIESEYCEFVILEKKDTHTVFYDKNTLVMYIVVTGLNGAHSITPIYNADGTVKLYSE